MVHQTTRCKKLQRVFYCNLSKKVQSGAPSGDENSSGPPSVRRAKTPQWGVFRARESPRWCTIPFGTDSHFAQALVFVSRGLVAKSRVNFPIQRNFVFRGKVDLAKQIAWCWHSV